MNVEDLGKATSGSAMVSAYNASTGCNHSKFSIKSLVQNLDNVDWGVLKKKNMFKLSREGSAEQIMPCKYKYDSMSPRVEERMCKHVCSFFQAVFFKQHIMCTLKKKHLPCTLQTAHYTLHTAKWTLNTDICTLFTALTVAKLFMRFKVGVNRSVNLCCIFGFYSLQRRRRKNWIGATGNFLVISW